MIATSLKTLSTALAVAVLAAAPALAASTAPVPQPHRVSPSASTGVSAGAHTWYGTVRDVHGARFDMVLRNGKVLTVDNGVPIQVHHALYLFAGRPVIVQGSMGANGVVRAQVVLRSHAMPAYWPADR
jgi:hypothetical protein